MFEKKAKSNNKSHFLVAFLGTVIGAATTVMVIKKSGIINEAYEKMHEKGKKLIEQTQNKASDLSRKTEKKAQKAQGAAAV